MKSFVNMVSLTNKRRITLAVNLFSKNAFLDTKKDISNDRFRLKFFDVLMFFSIKPSNLFLFVGNPLHF